MGLNDILDSVKKSFEEGAREGYNKGYEHGYEDGTDEQRDIFKPAVSDGLRKRSSECGKAMHKFK